METSKVHWYFPSFNHFHPKKKVVVSGVPLGSRCLCYGHLRFRKSHTVLPVLQKLAQIPNFSSIARFEEFLETTLKSCCPQLHRTKIVTVRSGYSSWLFLENHQEMQQKLPRTFSLDHPRKFMFTTSIGLHERSTNRPQKTGNSQKNHQQNHGNRQAESTFEKTLWITGLVDPFPVSTAFAQVLPLLQLHQELLSALHCWDRHLRLWGPTIGPGSSDSESMSKKKLLGLLASCIASPWTGDNTKEFSIWSG